MFVCFLTKIRLGFSISLTMAMFKKPLIFVIILLVLAIAGGVFFYTQYQNAQNELKKLKENPRASATEETKKLIDKVGELVALPKGEDPTVATITDVKKLKEQPFFAKAANGDKVLIYTQAKRAILYRPSTNKVIDIAPVNIGTGSAAAKQEPVKVALYNGTTKAGLTNTVGSRLQSELDNIEIVERANASRDDYEGIVVIDLSGRQKALADRIASLLGGQVGSLPSGENRPEADILVILGGKPSPTEEPTSTPSPTQAP